MSRRYGDRTPQLCELVLKRHAETEKAYLMSPDGDEDHAKWVPKSQIEIEPKDRDDSIFEVTMPRWLVEEKGWENEVI